MTPMMARNETGTWIMTSYQGQTCYFYNFVKTEEVSAMEVGMPVEKYLKKFDELEVFPAPPPCPTPTPAPRTKPSINCSKYTSEPTCMAAGCTWKFAALGPGYCSE